MTIDGRVTQDIQAAGCSSPRNQGEMTLGASGSLARFTTLRCRSLQPDSPNTIDGRCTPSIIRGARIT